MKTKEYDAIVVGSGITGGWAAKELCERGLKTLMIERGRPVEHVKDYVTEFKQPYDFRFRLLGDKRRYEADYPVQKQSSHFTEATEHFFINDRLNPYTHPDKKPFMWIRGHQLGGKSLTWGRQSYRYSPVNFEENLQDGHGTDWPVRYDDLAPWYSYVEKFIGVSGAVLNNPMGPDGEFLPPMEMNILEQAIAKKIASQFPERQMTIARMANITRPHNGRAPCQYRNLCARGCSLGGYFSTQSSTLPAAQKTNNLTVAADTVVQKICYDPIKKRVTGVQVINTKTREVKEYHSKIVVLCASAFESVRLLLNSANDSFPDGLANSSGVLGRYIMDHFPSNIVMGDLDGPVVPNYMGGRAAPLYFPRFRNVGKDKQAYSRGYQINGSTAVNGWTKGLRGSDVGVSLKESLKTPTWSMFLLAQCEPLPQEKNRLTLDPVVKDEWGTPVPNIDVSYGENEHLMREEATQTIVEIMEVAGVKNIRVVPIEPIPGGSIHEMGGARMGRDPKTSVLNGWNQAHDIPNLLVTDGAAMASAGNANPSLTYMAMTARACAHIADELKAGRV